MAENHPDQQEIVGFFPKGPYCKPFGWKPMFWACFEGSMEKQNIDTITSFPTE